MTHEDLRDALPAFAIDALDAVEQAEVSAHLETCAECRSELAVLHRVADGIGLEAPPVTPPAGLRARVLGAIPPREATPIHSIDAWRASAKPGRTASEAPVRRASWLMPLAAAASILAAAGALYYANGVSNEMAALRRHQQQVQRVMAAPDAVRVDLKAQTSVQDAHARAFWSRNAGMVFVAEGLPALSGGRVYQLWTITGTTATSAGTLTPAADGTAVLALPIDAAAPRPDAFGVTIEPAGGSASPTLPIVMLGSAGQ